MKLLNLRTILSISLKDIRIFLQNRGSMLYLMVVPVLFVLAFSSTTGKGNQPQEKAIILPVVNLDAGSQASSLLLQALEQGGAIQCEIYDDVYAEELLQKEKINRYMTIPS